METWDASAFDGEKLRRPGRVAVAFLADWCPFCRRFRPELEALKDQAGFVTAIVDITSEESPLWDTFHIRVVPTLALFDDGKLAWRRDGRFARGLSRRDLDDLVREASALPAGPRSAG